MALSPPMRASWVEDRAGSLNERKRQLLEWLAGRGAQAPGFQGRVGSAVGRMGGMGGRGPLPGLTYNPFLSQIAGRANENFPFLPSGLSSAAAQAAQQAPFQPGMGGVAGMGGGGAPMAAPGLGTSGIDAAPGLVQPQGGAAGRNLIGAGGPIPGLPPAINQPLLSNPQVNNPLIQPFDPYARLNAIGARGVYRD
jgi:hypothetical protein